METVIRGETLSWDGRHLHGGGDFVIPVQFFRPETLSWGDSVM